MPRSDLTLLPPPARAAALRQAALDYVGRGWAVLPLWGVIDGLCGCGRPDCKSPGKHPVSHLVPRGLHQATRNADEVRRWWAAEPLANIGIRTGQASGLLALDLDDRPEQGRDGMTSWACLLADAGARPPDTVEATTGGGGRHILLATTERWSSSRDHLGPGLEVKAENGYIVAAPSAHASGRDYCWDAAGHPDDQAVAPLPEWLRPLLRRGEPAGDTIAPLPPPPPLGPLEAAELGSALAAIPADDRDTWVAVGMACHQTGDPAAFDWWDHWSQTSEKYDAADARRVWRSFRRRHDEQAVTVASVYATAHRHGWERPSLEQLAQAAGVRLPVITLTDRAAVAAPVPAPVPDPPDHPPHPLTQPLPGHLETIAAWAMATAPSPVRLYAAAAAISLGSVLAARRFMTDTGNLTSLYCLVVGKSGTGKEHCRWVVDEVLAALAPDLRGPDSWTSASAVFSGLLPAPQQLAVIDEFGQYMGAANGAGDGSQHRESTLTQLMELFGRLHGTAYSPQYATLALSTRQQEAAARKTIQRPALSLLALTTPNRFWAAMRSERVASGFLNRFLVVDASDVPRGRFHAAQPVPLPDAVLRWGQHLLAPRGDLDQRHRLTELPPPLRVHLPPEVRDTFDAYRDHCNRLADQLESDGLGELPMRATEQAMRLALVAALAEDPACARLSPTHATWGVAVADASLSRLIPAVQSHMADSPVAALRKTLVRVIREAGPRGVTLREIMRGSAFIGTPTRDRDDAVAWVVGAGLAEWTVAVPSHDGGRPRRALVMAEPATLEAA